MSRTVKPIEAVSRLVVARNWAVRGIGTDYNRQKVSSGGAIKILWN
jgi:hypothetical protein